MWWNARDDAAILRVQYIYTASCIFARRRELRIMNFGENLRTLRRKKNISQEELAGKLNVSRQAVSRWEQGVSLR